MRKIILLLLLSVMFVSCKKKEDEEPLPTETGTWKLTQYHYREVTAGATTKTIDTFDSSDPDILVLNADGTGSVSSSKGTKAKFSYAIRNTDVFTYIDFKDYIPYVDNKPLTALTNFTMIRNGLASNYLAINTVVSTKVNGADREEYYIYEYEKVK